MTQSTLRSDERAFVIREAIIAAMVNAVLTLIMTWMAFGGATRIPIWGGSGVVADLVPSTFVPSLLMALMLTPVIRKRVASGQAPAVEPQRLPWIVKVLPRRLLARAFVLSVVFVVLIVPLVAGVLALRPLDGLDVGTVFIFKGLYGALFGAVLSPLIVLKALADECL